MNTQELALKVINRFGGQNNAARICGLNQSTLSLIANGKTTDVKISTIEKLKKGLKQKAEQKCTK